MWTEEQRKKHSERMKEYYREHPVSEETRRRIGMASKETWHNRTPAQVQEHQVLSAHSPQAREKQQEVWDSMTLEQRQDRMAKGCHSEEARRKQRAYLDSLTPEQMATRMKPFVAASITPAVCKKRSETMRRQFRNGERQPPARYGWTETKVGIMVRSSWEAMVCDLLSKLGIGWQYEPQAFDLGFASYRPDLYLPCYNIWIEIKGYWRDGEKAKVDAFSQTHLLLLIDEDKYNQLANDHSLIVEWLVSMR